MSEKYWSKRRLIHELRHGRLSSKLDANTIRIVAAVNACAGIPTAALEAGVVGEMVEALRSADAYIVTLRQRLYAGEPHVRFNANQREATEGGRGTDARAVLAKLDQEGSE